MKNKCKNCKVCSVRICKAIERCASFLRVKTGIPNATETLWVLGRSGTYHFVTKVADAAGFVVIDVVQDLTEGFFFETHRTYALGFEDPANANRKIEYDGVWYDYIEFVSRNCESRPPNTAVIATLNP